MSQPTITQPTGQVSFGPFIGIAQVRTAVIDTLNLWLPSYLWEASRRTGIPVTHTFPGPQDGLRLWPFQSWTYEPAMRPMSPHEEPQWSVGAGPTLGEPHRKGDGTFVTEWAADVTVWVYGDDYSSTRDLTGIYITCVRQALLQHGSLGGFATLTRWRGDQQFVTEQTAAYRTLGHITSLFGITVDNTLNAYAGPLEPLADVTVDPAPDPTPTGLLVDLVKEPITGEPADPSPGPHD